MPAKSRSFRRFHPFARGWWIAGCLGLTLTACSSIPPADYAAENLPAQVELDAVPFHPQQAYQCGPAALATVLGAAGATSTADELRDAVFLPQRQGSLQAELLAATRRAGFLPYVLTPEPAALLAELAAGHPVLVLQDLGFAFAPRWHYAVAVGYDRPERQVSLRSGSHWRQTMSFEGFDRSWAKAGRWAFVAAAPEHIPATAAEDRFVAAAVTLEAVVPAAAMRAYRAALDRWPDNLIARLGLGNAAYRQHDLATAEAAYRQATVDHPEAADTWNNLAQLLHESGRNAEARVAVRRAIAIGGPRQDIYAATLAAIKRGTAPLNSGRPGRVR